MCSYVAPGEKSKFFKMWRSHRTLTLCTNCKDGWEKQFAEKIKTDADRENLDLIGECYAWLFDKIESRECDLKNNPPASVIKHKYTVSFDYKKWQELADKNYFGVALLPPDIYPFGADDPGEIRNFIKNTSEWAHCSPECFTVEPPLDENEAKSKNKLVVYFNASTCGTSGWLDVNATDIVCFDHVMDGATEFDTPEEAIAAAEERLKKIELCFIKCAANPPLRGNSAPQQTIAERMSVYKYFILKKEEKKDERL